MGISLDNGEGAPGTGLTSALVSTLIMYEYRQAEGRLTSGLKSALRLYVHQQRQARLIAQIAMLNGIIQANTEATKRIMANIATATPEEATESLKQAKQLQKQTRRIGRQLEDLAK